MESSFHYHLETLPSGLRLVTIPMPAAKTVAVFVFVKCGSTYEPRKWSGISHFLEHMMFKGTKRRPGYLDISRELERVGATYNAFTGKEITGYYAKVATNKLDTIADVVFDIFLNSKLEQQAMEIERGPILEELRMRRDDPRQHIGQLLEELLYGDQPAGWEVGGTPETIKGMMSPDLRQWFDTHYVAGNTVVAVAGNINAEEVTASVQRAFEHIRQAEPTAKSAVIERQESPAIKTFAKDVEQLYVQLGIRAYNLYDDRRYPLALLAQILGGGMSSRLFDEVREKRGLAYFVSASQSAYTDSGYFEVGAGLNQEKAAEGIKVILGELAKTAESGVTEEELQQVKDQAEGRMAFMLESTDGVAEDFGSSVVFRGCVLTPEEELGKIRAVTRDDIRAVAADIFRNDRLNLVAIGPKITDDQFRNLVSF